MVGVVEAIVVSNIISAIFANDTKNTKFKSLEKYDIYGMHKLAQCTFAIQ